MNKENLHKQESCFYLENFAIILKNNYCLLKKILYNNHMERMTSQRKDILEALGYLGHASFHTVFDYLINNGKKISLSTLYRNISSLEDDKYIRKVDLINGDEIMYELTRLDEHEHFVCTKCGRVIDIFNKKKHRHYDDNGNLIEKTSITYYGVCKDCLEKQKEEKEI